MGDAYPELIASKSQIENVLLAEEEQFAKTLDKGMGVLEAQLEASTGDVISGEIVFTLYDTYGFPVDLTNDIARERNLQLDMKEYERLMNEQKQKSKDAGTFKMDYTASIAVDGETLFSGYNELKICTSVSAVLNENGESVGELREGEKASSCLKIHLFMPSPVVR